MTDEVFLRFLPPQKKDSRDARPYNRSRMTAEMASILTYFGAISYVIKWKAPQKMRCFPQFVDKVNKKSTLEFCTNIIVYRRGRRPRQNLF